MTVNELLRMNLEELPALRLADGWGMESAFVKADPEHPGDEPVALFCWKERGKWKTSPSHAAGWTAVKAMELDSMERTRKHLEDLETLTDHMTEQEKGD